jgi:hypothetical protein
MKISQEEFDRRLKEKASSTTDLLQIPGIYEILEEEEDK